VLLRAKLKARDERRAPKASRLTLDAWLDEWLAQMAMARPRTHPFYRQKLAHVRPHLGSTVLTELDGRAIRLALADLRGAGMSGSMLHHVYRSLGAALNAAVAEQRLDRNPCQGITAPRRSEFEATTLTVEQSQRLLAVARDTKMGPLAELDWRTGTGCLARFGHTLEMIHERYVNDAKMRPL
jgi:site-specific recombinase XerC